MKSKRHGNTDHSVAMGALRRELKAFIQSHPRSSRAVLVEHGKKLLRDGLFEKHEDDYLGYIATNAVSMAEGDYAAATGRSAVTGLPASEPPKATRSASTVMSMGIAHSPATEPPKGSWAPSTAPAAVAARAARRANETALAAAHEATIVKRTICALASDCTEHEVWEMGGALRGIGCRGSKKLIWRTKRTQLEKLGITEV